MRWWTLSIGLLLPLTGACGKTETIIAPVPELVRLAPCPAPEAPELPRILAAPLDSPANLLRLRLRDEVLRGYIDGLEAALTCYQGQAAPATSNMEE